MSDHSRSLLVKLTHYPLRRELTSLPPCPLRDEPTLGGGSGRIHRATADEGLSELRGAADQSGIEEYRECRRLATPVPQPTALLVPPHQPKQERSYHGLAIDA